MFDDYQRIKQLYLHSQGDSTGLFAEILRASTEIGMDKALACLEQCVIEKRLAWLNARHGEVQNGDDPVMDGYRWFYEKYLGVCIPEDGEMVERSAKRMVMRWWNPCPTLEACQKLGLDTKEICRKAYQKPVEEFLNKFIRSCGLSGIMNVSDPTRPIARKSSNWMSEGKPETYWQALTVRNMLKWVGTARLAQVMQ